MRIGIMGGTFDPIHNGHLLIAEQARTFLSLDKVIFIPSGNPPHKAQTTNGDQRMEMINLAIKDNSYFTVSDIELKRKGLTYTIDTLRELKVKYGIQADLYFIIGTDTLFELETWKSWSEICNICNFALMQRPGFENKEIDRQIEFLLNKYNAKIIKCESITIDASSSIIRNKLCNGETVKYLLPDVVIDYINKNRIY
jgi:nicotinate-nucleotide adenylyltransferase